MGHIENKKECGGCELNYINNINNIKCEWIQQTSQKAEIVRLY